MAGSISAVKVLFPWTKTEREPAKAPAGVALFGPLVALGVTIIAVLFGLIFAIGNLRKNRGDRKGALRIAMVVGCMALMGWLASAHHVASLDEWSLFSKAVADAAFTGLVLWILYLALEPAVRARWPQALVTWNRLLGAVSAMRS